jgi:hypothetical protein
MDSTDESKHIGWYGPRGGKLWCPPFDKAVELFKKCKADPNHHWNVR